MNRLRMLVNRIALVPKGANPGAHVLLWKSADPAPNLGGEATDRREERMSAIDVIEKAAQTEDRDQVFARVEKVARETFPDLPRAQAVDRYLLQFPEAGEAVYRAALPKAAPVAKAEPPGQGWVRGLEAIAKSRGITSDEAMQTAAGAGVVAGYYASVGDTLNAQRWREQAELAARQASG